MKFQLYKDLIGQWRFRLIAGNGEIVAISESYTRRASAVKTINRIVEEIKGGTVEIENQKPAEK